MLLKALTLLFVACVGVASLICLALGLLSLSQYMESNAARARRTGLRALYLAIGITLLVTLIDDVPLQPLLPALLAAPIHYIALSHPSWPFTPSSAASPPSTAWSAVSSIALLPLASHVWLVRHHTLTTHAWHQHRYDTIHRPKLPGGRLDWDVVDSANPPGVKEMTNLEVCAVLTICVWSIPVYRLLGRVAAAEWGSGGIVAGGSTSCGMERAR